MTIIIVLAQWVCVRSYNARRMMEIKNKVKETSPTSKQSGPFDSYINSNSGQQQNCLLFHKLKMSAFDVNVTMVGLRCRRDLHSASVI